MRQTLRDLSDEWLTEHELDIILDGDDIVIYDTVTRQPVCAVELNYKQLRVLAWCDESEDPTVTVIGER